MPWIEANGASLRYELSGSGQDTLVLVHEAGGCLESSKEAVPGFEKDFRVLRYDHRGFGRSPAPDTTYSPFRDLIHRLDRAEMDRAHIVGSQRVPDM